MKYIAILLLACVLSACAATGSKSSEIKGPFVVTGYGKTEELAKQDAFKKAVEFAVGVGIQTERIVSDNKVGRNYVLAHSSGYVDSFRIVDITKSKDNVEMLMEVYIRPTLVDDYIFNSGKVEQKVEGNFINEQMDTYMAERKNGDAMLDAILKDYPEKAYTIVMPTKSYEFMVDSDRRYFVRFRYKIRFSDEYLKSLAQMFGQLKDVECKFKCGSYPSYRVIYRKKPDDYLFANEVFYFRDTFKVEKVYKHLSGQNFSGDMRYIIKIDFQDLTKNTLNTVCLTQEEAKVRRNLSGSHEYFISNDWIADNTIEIPVSYDNHPTRLKQNIDKLDYIKLSVVRPDLCIEK